MTHHRNLCPTVESRAQHRTLPCTVPRAKTSWVYARVAADEDDPEERQRILFDRAHTWPPGQRATGACLQCGLTLKQVTVRINPKTGEPVRRSGGLARAIAMTAADVPPVHFTRVTP